MSKKSLLIAAVLFFLLIATAMAIENKNASENFTGQEYLNTGSIETVPDTVNGTDAEEYPLQADHDSVDKYVFGITALFGE